MSAIYHAGLRLLGIHSVWVFFHDRYVGGDGGIVAGEDGRAEGEGAQGDQKEKETHHGG